MASFLSCSAPFLSSLTSEIEADRERRMLLVVGTLGTVIARSFFASRNSMDGARRGLYLGRDRNPNRSWMLTIFFVGSPYRWACWKVGLMARGLVLWGLPYCFLSLLRFANPYWSTLWISPRSNRCCSWP